VPAWAWIIALVPLSIVGLAVASGLSVYGLRKYLALEKGAEASEASSSAAVSRRLPPLTGEASDLSSVMGRARKLAEQWQPEAALLGIEAMLTEGKVQTQHGASAKLTFGPSPFATKRPPSDLFVVTYDMSGITGVPADGRPSKALPEPRCAPEHVLHGVTDLGSVSLVLRYAFDSDERALWFVSPAGDPTQLRVFDPHDCRQRGNIVVAPHARR